MVLVLFLAGPAAGNPGPAGGGPFRLLLSDASGVTVQFDAGPAMDAPRGAGIALPAGCRGVCTVEGGASGVHFEEIGVLRDVRAGRIRVDPGVRSARIRIDFVARDHHPPDANASGPSAPRPAGSPTFADTYRTCFLNGADAVAFSVLSATEDRGDRDSGSPLPERGARNGESAGRGSSGGRNARAGIERTPETAAEFRFRVGRSGWYAVTVSDLVPLGWPEQVPVAEVRLFEKTRNPVDPADPLETDVPVLVIDDSGDPGIFDAGDRFLFYGRDQADRFAPAAAAGRFTRVHCYWLTCGNGNGARIGSEDGWMDAAGAVTPASFTSSVRFEDNSVYVPDIPGQPGTPFPVLDTFYWIGTGVPRQTLSLETPGLVSGGVVRIRAFWQGFSLNSHFVSLRAGRSCAAPPDTVLLSRGRFEGAEPFRFDSGPIPSARFPDGCWPLEVEGRQLFPGREETGGSGALFDRVEVTYPRSYRLVDGRLEFDAGGLTGDVEFVLHGLRRPEMFLFRVTDAGNPVRVNLAPERYRQRSGPPFPDYEVRFRACVSGSETWTALEPDRIPGLTAAGLPPDLVGGAIARVERSGITEDTGADLIVLCHPRFRAELQPLLDHRAAQGHRIAVAAPQEVWDLFSGGDKSVPAIRDWLRHVFRAWARPPEHLLIVGDASEDYRKDLGMSDPDWVPTMMLYGSIPGPNSRVELVGSDNYYVGALAPGDLDGDLLPDMHVGRLPVGSEAETRAVVSKLILYDRYGDDELWRRRGLVVSDDRYSDSILGTGSYCLRPEEITFESGGDSLCAEISRNACAVDFRCEHLRMSALLDTVAALGRGAGNPDCPDVTRTRDYVKARIAPLWIAESSRGHLFQSFSGHSSRVKLGTEGFVEFNGAFTSPANRDPEQLTNVGRPFVFLGIGCHVNEFEYFGEAVTEHSIGEAMVLLPNRGAIASIGSTGYELVALNRPLQVYLNRALFTDLPLDPASGLRRRILGEGKDQALVRMAVELGGGASTPGLIQNLFTTTTLLGDPTMRIDMGPARAELRVNGGAVEPGAAIAAAPGGFRARIEARLMDDVDVGGVSLRVDGIAVPESEFSVSADSVSCGRRLLFDTELEPASYPIVIETTDWLGRRRDYPLTVELRVDWSSGGRPLSPDQVVTPDAGFQVRVNSPVPLLRAEVDVSVNGEAGPFDWSPVDPERRVWEAASTSALPEGRLDLQVLIRGEPVRSGTGRLAIRVQSEFSIRDLYSWPNPWEGAGPVRFFCSLNAPAGDAPTGEITVFSVAGRLVARFPISVEVGQNRFDWLPRDSRGDMPANGVYLYKVTIRGARGNRTALERLVIHR